jgi:hypothetical protein
MKFVKYTLSLKPVASARSGAEYGTGTVMLYEVDGLPEGQRISIRNVRSVLQEPIWQIGGHSRGMPTKWTGVFKTAEHALAQLQTEIDSADEATHEHLEQVATTCGWQRIPVLNDSNNVIFTFGPSMVRVRINDHAWAFYTDTAGTNRLPDKWGKDFPSLLAFFASYDARIAVGKSNSE